MNYKKLAAKQHASHSASETAEAHKNSGESAEQVRVGLNVDLDVQVVELVSIVSIRQIAGRFPRALGHARIRKPHRPPLRGLIRFADLFGLSTRKSIKALAGDFDTEIRRLRRQRRQHMARWNILLAWGYALWFVLRSPLDKAVSWAVKMFRGG